MVRDFRPRCRTPRSTSTTTTRRTAPRTSRAKPARWCGASACRERERDPPHVRDIEADVYVMVDGDATYDAGVAPDWSACSRTSTTTWWRRTRVTGHAGRLPARAPLGNRVLTGLVRASSVTHHRHALRLSRVLAAVREVLPGAVRRFETETELTVHALELRCRSPRSRHLQGAAGRVDLEAQHLGRWLSDPARDRAAGEGGAAIGVLLQRRGGPDPGSAAAFHPGSCRLHADGSGAAAANGSPVDGSRAARLPFGRLPAPSSIGLARTQGVEAARLPLRPGLRGRCRAVSIGVGEPPVCHAHDVVARRVARSDFLAHARLRNHQHCGVAGAARPPAKACLVYAPGHCDLCLRRLTSPRYWPEHCNRLE